MVRSHRRSKAIDAISIAAYLGLFHCGIRSTPTRLHVAWLSPDGRVHASVNTFNLKPAPGRVSTRQAITIADVAGGRDAYKS